MSADQTRRALNQLNSEIAALEKKSADFGKKEASARGNAARTVKGISKNASAATLRSKQSQVDRYSSEATKAASDKAAIDKKIADKKKKQADTMVKLQKEEAADRKKADKTQNAIQQSYENRIAELSRQMISVPSISNPYTGNTTSNEPAAVYDVFVSHAWEDKESFANEFVEELTALGVSVWYDKDKIAWGDPMRARIDDGLRKSKFGVVVISPNYIADGKYWTKTELDGLFQLESVNGKMLLPIWHNITNREVMDYSPIIAGRLAMTTASMTPKEIADELVKLLPDAVLRETTDMEAEDAVNNNAADSVDAE